MVTPDKFPIGTMETSKMAPYSYSDQSPDWSHTVSPDRKKKGGLTQEM